MNLIKVLFLIIFSHLKYYCENKNLNDCKSLCDKMLDGDLNECVDKCIVRGSNLRSDLDACEKKNVKKCQIICQESDECMEGCFNQYCSYIYYDVMFLIHTFPPGPTNHE